MLKVLHNLLKIFLIFLKVLNVFKGLNIFPIILFYFIVVSFEVISNYFWIFLESAMVRVDPCLK